nr:hypothetical protein [Tanacetum cinerariifolium]
MSVARIVKLREMSSKRRLNNFTDVIGDVAAVGDVIHGERKGKPNRRIVIELKDIEGLKMKCTLWMLLSMTSRQEWILQQITLKYASFSFLVSVYTE